MKNEMYKLDIHKTIILILLSAAIFASIFLKYLPYWLYNYDFLIGFDSGKYIYDFIYKLSTEISLIDLWVEPGLNTNLASLDALINLNPITYYKIFLPTFVSINLILIVYLFSKKLTGSSIAGIISSLYFTSSSIFLNATFDSFYRQLMGTIILMVLFYLIEKSYKSRDWNINTQILFSILGAGIIMTHRAITLLYILIFIILILLATFQKNFKFVRQILLTLFASLLLSSVYWLNIVMDNITVIKDTIFMSIGGQHGGATTIKVASRTDNQIISYLTFIPTAFLPILGVIYLVLKRKFNLYTFFVLFLLIYIAIRATFSNRFLVNLELLFSIAVGIVCFYLSKILDKKIFLTIVIGVLILNFGFSYELSISKRPYVDTKSESFNWLENNIIKDSSLIIAPDGLATILGQLGFRTSIYEYKPKRGGMDSLIYTETFLLTGHKDPSLLKDASNNFKETYVILNEWNLVHPLTKSGEVIQVKDWDESKEFEMIYKNSDSIQRVYRYKASSK